MAMRNPRLVLFKGRILRVRSIVVDRAEKYVLAYLWEDRRVVRLAKDTHEAQQKLCVVGLSNHIGIILGHKQKCPGWTILLRLGVAFFSGHPSADSCTSACHAATGG